MHHNNVSAPKGIDELKSCVGFIIADFLRAQCKIILPTKPDDYWGFAAVDRNDKAYVAPLCWLWWAREPEYAHHPRPSATSAGSMQAHFMSLARGPNCLL